MDDYPILQEKGAEESQVMLLTNNDLEELVQFKVDKNKGKNDARIL